MRTEKEIKEQLAEIRKIQKEQMKIFRKQGINDTKAVYEKIGEINKKRLSENKEETEFEMSLRNHEFWVTLDYYFRWVLGEIEGNWKKQ